MNGKTLARRKKRMAGRARLGPVDGVLLHTLALLLGFGLVMVASASLSLAVTAKYELPMLFFFWRTLIYLALGLVLMALLLQVPLDWLERFSPSLILFVYILLLLVFVPGVGVAAKGGGRWIQLGPFGLQVVELVKLMLIVYLAGYLTRHEEAVRAGFMGMFKPMLLLGVVALLLLLQPDFGSTVLVLAIGVLMLWVGGARIRDLLLLGVLGVPVLVLEMVREPYRMERLMAFLDPWKDPTASGFQLIQALIAVGRGEWFGTGLGASIQKLYYLPEAHNDFILAVIAEELGFAGVLLVAGLYAVLIWRSMLIGKAAMDEGRPFVAHLCWGVAGWIGLQSLISMAVNVGLLPTKGLTLPFISYGGSSLLMACMAMGLVLRASREVRLSQVKQEVAHA